VGIQWWFFPLTDVMVTKQRHFLDNRRHDCSFIYKNATTFLTTSFFVLTVIERRR